MSSRRVVLGFAVLVALAANARAEPVTLRVGTLAVDGSRYMQDILALSKEITKRTRGGVALEWISGGQLGDDQTMADLVVHGKLDGGGFSEIGLGALVPEMAVWRYPGLFQSYDEVDRATTALDPTIREQFAKRNMVFMMWADLGFTHVFSTEPITTLRDMLQKATPWITMPLDGKLTEAVTSGRAHAWALPPLYMLAIGNAKARYMSSLRYRYVVGGLVISQAAWSQLTEAQQATVRDVCRDWQPRVRESWRRETERGIAALEKSGVKIHAVSAAELAAFVDASAKSRVTHAAAAGVAELTAKVVTAKSR
jgi:TRAP-type C4-dicarboxylate transport system substrate-binding protein